ncbi:MAG: thioredoxin domain-containing protein [Candidatus Omnitrophota bacterium]
MKNNLLAVVLVVLIGALSGLALLVGINNTMQMAISPISTRLSLIESTQRVILQKVGSSGQGDSQVMSKLSGIESQLVSLQSKMGPARPSFAPPAPPQEDFNKTYTIDIGSSPVNGKKDASITIVDFADFQCPFCARFYPQINEVIKAYPGKIRFVIKNFPLSFHPNARPAAKLALAANEQGKYFEMVELLLQNGADASDAKVKEYAKTLKLNYVKLTKDVKNKDAEYEKRINDDIALGGQVDVQGTPTFFLNGKKTMARDLNGYKTEIDKILAGK